MKWFLAMMVSVAMLIAPTVSLASFNQSDLTNLNNGEPNRVYARDHGYKFGQGKCTFDPSANTSERTIAAHECGLKIPDGAFVTGAWYHVLTTFTSATDAATIAIHIASANDVVSAVAISNGGNPWDAANAVEGVPKNDDSTTWIETTNTAGSPVTFTVASEALTAGKLVLWVTWFYADDVD